MLRGNSSVKGCVNDVSECSRRSGLKEMRWNRIKQTSSVTGKDEFKTSFLAVETSI